ncbi:IucA/IucC family C-terminal-domain containing protein [Bacillus swezeyi]|uniref:Siderophore biosynthesis protein n=1 Tax=Bacillus swezeyi TaxID=1925020 RepID=A0A5M8RPY4_9BACI|nr:IucA/IucC family C-terminal-domain containing protein [Bacillus swezeyi]KAA6450585.1 siderophore biosynthesis protein [Bacillus swezeyi]KAA6475239.1 siderophore biosynthesis protein [Bacillus swezeyi]TYS37120.1 siderophore biosynthesis protein [Bacillus swezeyi]
MLNLKKEELESLLRFRLGTKQTGSLLSVKGSMLLNEDFLRSYVQDIKDRLNAPNQKVAASMMIKRCGMLAVMHFYLFTVYGKRLPRGPASMSWEIEGDDEGWAPLFYFTEGAEPAEGNRREALEQLTEDIFRNHVGRLIAACRRACSVSKQILWENIAVYLFWMYETLQTEMTDLKLREQAAQDFHFLLYEAQPGLFEEDADENPLGRFYPGHDGDDRIRATCCLYYATDQNGVTCSTCPRKKRKERVS